MSDDGWVKAWRSRWTHPAFRNLRDAAIWSFLVDNAVWRDTDTRFEERRVQLSRGQIIVSERFLAKGFCCDRQVIRRVLEILESDQMITREKPSGATIISICNYDRFQSSSEIEKPSFELERTQGEPRENPNKKESKKIKNQEGEGSRGSRLKPDWKLPKEYLDMATDHGLTADQTDYESDQFRDYYLGAPGAKGLKSDWLATWRGWIRRGYAKREPQTQMPLLTAIEGGKPARNRIDEEWVIKIRVFLSNPNIKWPEENWGPPPSDPRCHVPPSVLAEFPQIMQRH